jgi:anti-sigma B factor antagonist
MIPGWGAAEDLTPGGSIVVTPHAEGPVMHMSGDVDAELIGRAGGANAFDCQSIVAVDVGELGYIDSSGLSLLVKWARSRANTGADAVIRGVTPRFAKVLDVSGLTDVFVIER